MSLELEFGCFGSSKNSPLLILHGLLGSSRNWMSLGKDLSAFYNVFMLDMRNHGRSPHTDSHTYADMVEDLIHWLDRKRLGNFFIMGHSMGGKVAMAYACRHPERVLGLVIEDIAPREYKLRYEEDFKLMNALDLPHLNSRQEADDFLAQRIPEAGWRQFLLSNLVRDPQKGFFWQINLQTLTRYLPDMMKNSLAENEKFLGPTLILRGALSDYIKDEDKAAINARFPHNVLVKVPEAGHNVHVDNKEAVLEALKAFREHMKG